MNIKSNIDKIKSSLKQYPDVKIMAVVKNRELFEIEEVINQGINILGVNRWQEFKNKFVNNNVGTGRDLSVHGNNKNIQFHFIGHLQKNKVKDVIQYFDCIQSVDSLELLEKINVETRHAASLNKINKKINILIQINISHDPNKHGVLPENLSEFLMNIKKFDHIKLIGLMAITAKEETEKIREDFKSMKKLFDQYKKQYNLTELSMGMSNDYLVAAEEGATMVRIGSAIFQ